MGIIEEYLELTYKYKKEYGEKTIILMQCGSFMEVYSWIKDGIYQDSDILEFSKICDMIIAPKSKVLYKKNPVVMAGFGIGQIEKYVKKLQEFNYTIVIYTQDIQGKNTTRSLSEIISPGTFFANDENKISNITMSITVNIIDGNKYLPKSLFIGLSTIDILTGISTLHEYTIPYHHNPSSYDNIERLVSTYNPSEILFLSNMEEKQINDIYTFIGIKNIKVHNLQKSNIFTKNQLDNSFKQNYQYEMFQSYFSSISYEIIQEYLSTYPHAIQSFIVLLEFIGKHSPFLINKLNFPIFENISNNLLLANHSLKQLNIIDDSRHFDKNRSVGCLLNNCVTPMGVRKFFYILNNPTIDISILNESYDITENLLNDEYYVNIRKNIIGITDIEKLKRKIIINKFSPKDLVILSQNIDKLFACLTFCSSNQKFSSFIMNNYQININKFIENCENFNNCIKKTFNLINCSKLDDISNDKLKSFNSNEIIFVNSEIDEGIDKVVNNCLNNREKLYGIANKLSEIIGNIEKGNKNYVKIHETPKSDPCLIATNRRCTLLKNWLKTNKESSVSIFFKNYNNQEDEFSFDLFSKLALSILLYLFRI